MALLRDVNAYQLVNSPLVSPAVPLIVTNNRNVAPSLTKFLVSEEHMSFTNDDFKIVDQHTGLTAYIVSGKVMTMRQRKTLATPDGSPQWTMVHSFTKFLGRRYKMTTTAGKEFTIRHHKRWTRRQNKRLTATLPSGEQLLLEVSPGDRLSVLCMTSGTRVIPIARVQRTLHTVRNVVGNVQDYSVEIAPNVDITLVMAFVIALDETSENDGKRSYAPAQVPVATMQYVPQGNYIAQSTTPYQSWGQGQRVGTASGVYVRNPYDMSVPNGY